jgi:uncharacterized membrane protein YgdD (TMEM256/DUF423 family)
LLPLKNKVSDPNPTPSSKTPFLMVLGPVFILLGVALGAIGAHFLERRIDEKFLQIFKTGIQYQLVHGLGILVLTFLKVQAINLRPVIFILSLSIILFSFNCYFYSVFAGKITFFAHLIPIGGIGFILGWSLLIGLILKNGKEIRVNNF